MDVSIMKRMLALLLITVLLITPLVANSNYFFIENYLQEESDFYTFIDKYFKERSLSMVNYSERIVVDEKNIKIGSKDFYDMFLNYVVPFFPDPNFYTIDRIILHKITYSEETPLYISERGILKEGKAEFSFIIKDCYNPKGIKIDTENKHIDGTIYFFRYPDKILITSEYASIDYNWVLSSYEDLLVEKLKKGEINVINTEDENHYMERY